MTLERILLQTIKFDLQVEHPYSYLLKYAKCLKGESLSPFFFGGGCFAVSGLETTRWKANEAADNAMTLFKSDVSSVREL